MPKGYFSCSQGVRQGDPISQLLFVLAEEVLSRMISKKVDDGLIASIRTSRQRGRVPTHFLYADDVVLFCRATMSNMKEIQDVLDKYAMFSGQVVYKAKSTVYVGEGVSRGTKSRILSFLQVGIGSLPFVYLGVPLFYGAIRRVHMRGILDKLLNHFASWKGSTLSFAGRLDLIKSIIYGSMLHSAMVYKWPISQLDELESAIRNFLLTGNRLQIPSCSVNWRKCCQPIDAAGLGLRRLRALNKALLCKLAFRIIS